MTRSSSSDEPGNPTFVNYASLDSSTPLEASAPLDYGDEIELVAQTNATPKVPSVIPEATNVDVQRNELQVERDNINQPVAVPTLVEEQSIQLLEERLVVNQQKRKVGEIVVRKVIETRIVEVPVRRERLLVEQIGSEHRQLASIDLGQPTSDAVEFVQGDSTSQLAVNSEFASIKAAAHFLATIASSQPNLGCKTVQVRIVADSVEQQQHYQQWLNRYLENQSTTLP